ncbi:hypothetical protein [Thiolapillus sp.]
MNNRFAKWNIAVGLFVMAGFMIYGFVLIYLRDFAAGKEAWIAASHTGKHFEARLAHVHGNLFSVLNILYGYLLLKLAIPSGYARWVSRLALAGLLMPIGIFAELYFGLPFYLVLVGAISIVSATVLLGIGALKMSS